MNKSFISAGFAAASTMLLSSMSFATGITDIRHANNQLAIQEISTNFDYTETGNGRLGTNVGTLNTEKGIIAGYGVSLSLMKDIFFANDYLNIAYSRSTGYTNYVGANIAGGTYGSIVSTSKADITDYTLRIGEGLVVNADLMLTPFIELNHHKWYRGVNYGETYYNSRYGIGVMGQYSILNGLVASAYLTAGKTIGSRIDIASGPGSIGFSGALGNSFVYTLGGSFDYAVMQNVHISMGIDYIHYKYGISAIYPSGAFVAWEPDSITANTTARAGIGFSF